jgi:hypothetical protein
VGQWTEEARRRQMLSCLESYEGLVGEEAEGGCFISGGAWPALRYTESVYIEKYLQRTDICSLIAQSMILHERKRLGSDVRLGRSGIGNASTTNCDKKK